MSLALVAAALLAQGSAVAAPTGSTTMSTDSAQAESVAYAELANGREMAAIRKLQQAQAVRDGDPAALINLGTAYARAGMMDAARASYRAAVESDMRYDLELADGSWMDSRDAARVALRSLSRVEAIAAR